MYSLEELAFCLNFYNIVYTIEEPFYEIVRPPVYSSSVPIRVNHRTPSSDPVSGSAPVSGFYFKNKPPHFSTRKSQLSSKFKFLASEMLQKCSSACWTDSLDYAREFIFVVCSIIIELQKYAAKDLLV